MRHYSYQLCSLLYCFCTAQHLQKGTCYYVQESSTAYTLKCNIAGDTNYLHQGLTLGLVEDREKNSEALGRLALFKGSSQIQQLPPYLTIQEMRFFYKADVQQKAKILRKVCKQQPTLYGLLAQPSA